MPQNTPDDTSNKHALMRPLRLRIFATRWVMIWERFITSFWPTLTLGIFIWVIFRWGFLAILPRTLTIILLCAAIAGVLFFLRRGWQTFHRPLPSETYTRLDATLQDAPIRSLADELALGRQDGETRDLWQAHLQRMAQKAKSAEVPAAHIRLARKDPFALRLIALIALLCTGIFAGGGSTQDTLDNLTGRAQIADQGPSFEVWAKPPLYTGLPTVYLNDVEQGVPLSMAEGSEFLVRAYGPVGDVDLDENLSVTGRTELPTETGVLGEVSFVMTQSGTLALRANSGASRTWDITLLADLPPQIVITGEMTRDLQGAMQLPFRAMDDYGVTGGHFQIELDIDNVDRRYGFAMAPEPVPNLLGELPIPFNESAQDFDGTIQEDYARHVWAGLPVQLNITATDAAQNQGMITSFHPEFARKRFFDPLASALIDVRKQMMWNRENADRGLYLLRAITHKPEGSFSQNKAYLMTRSVIHRLVEHNAESLSDEVKAEIVEQLWEAALLIEEGDLNDAKERLKRAQERLSEAMENGATEDEIAELMEELREATRDYMRHLAENAEEQDQQQSSSQSDQTISQDQLQQMMDRIQELMEQGNMEEAQKLLQELQEMMENMRVVKQEGQGGESDMDNMQGMLQEQQDLADETFRELQDQFDQQQGEQGQQDGQQGDQQGQQQDGQQGSEQGDQAGQGQQGEQSGEGQSDNGKSDLAGRQRALRDMLNDQQGRLPNDGSKAGEDAQTALSEAEREMNQAEESLRNGNLGQALNEQADALEAMRRGMRALGEQQRQAQNGGEGFQQDQEGLGAATDRDPLGRSFGQNQDGLGMLDEGQTHSLDSLDHPKAYQDLLQDLKGRAQDRTRPEFELDYLERLLDRF